MKTVLVLLVSFALSFAVDPDLEEFASNNKKFSSAVYDKILLDNKDNIVVSPFSVKTVLALTEAGAKDETATEIRRSLYLPKTEEDVEAVMKNALSRFKSDDYILKTANKVYVEENYSIKENFKAVADEVYQAAFENVEFSDSVNTAEEINKWVEEETENKIQHVIEPDDLIGDTKVVLVNALYFKSNWSIPFYPSHTQKAKFFTSSDDFIEAETMYAESLEVNYYESEELDAQILELPFRGDGASMTFILPKKTEGIALLEKSVNDVLLNPKFGKEFVEISLPKFRIESTIDFNKILPELGIKKAFDASEADFSGIGGEKGDLFIGKVTQKTFIDVNEVGVEAAAATAVVEPDSVAPPTTKSFIADHPFMFYITVEDMVLFEGRVLKPEYTTEE